MRPAAPRSGVCDGRRRRQATAEPASLATRACGRSLRSRHDARGDASGTTDPHPGLAAWGLQAIPLRSRWSPCWPASRRRLRAVSASGLTVAAPAKSGALRHKFTRRASAPRAWPPQGPFGLSVPMSPSPSGTDRTPVLAGRGGRGPGRVRPFRRRRTALRAPVRRGVRAAAPLHPSPAGGPAPSVACRAAPALEAHTHDWQHNFQLGTRIIPRQGSQKFAAPPAPVSTVSPYSP